MGNDQSVGSVTTLEMAFGKFNYFINSQKQEKKKDGRVRSSGGGGFHGVTEVLRRKRTREGYGVQEKEKGGFTEVLRRKRTRGGYDAQEGGGVSQRFFSCVFTSSAFRIGKTGGEGRDVYMSRRLPFNKVVLPMFLCLL